MSQSKNLTLVNKMSNNHINMAKFWISYHTSIIKNRKHYSLTERLYSIRQLTEKYKKDVIIYESDLNEFPTREKLIKMFFDAGCTVIIDL